MSVKEMKNVAASVLARLRNVSKSSGAPFQQVLQQYAIERFLYRISKSTHVQGVTARTLGTAMNPAVVNAFALAITGGEEPAAYPGVAGHEPNVANGRRDAKQMKAAFEPLLALLEKPASYVSETDYFEADWQQAFWGAHYARLKQIKRRYDPEGLFFVHHGVGSEDWSADGFERVT
jgi:hypothetical protein